MPGSGNSVDTASIAESLVMLERYLRAEDIRAVVAVLQEMQERPEDGTLLPRLSAAVEELGILQGAVLTYAPVIAGLLSDDPFGDGD
jgi:hypothetical protein